MSRKKGISGLGVCVCMSVRINAKREKKNYVQVPRLHIYKKQWQVELN